MIAITELPLWSFFYQLANQSKSWPNPGRFFPDKKVRSYILFKHTEEQFILFDLDNKTVNTQYDSGISNLEGDIKFIASNIPVVPKGNLYVLRLNNSVISQLTKEIRQWSKSSITAEDTQ